MSIALGLDLGTTSISAIGVDASGRVAATAVRNHGSDLTAIPAGRAEQDPQRTLHTAADVLKELTGRLDAAPVCLGLTGQMHGVLLVDRNRQPLTPLITWQDRRSIEPHPRRNQSLLEAFLSATPAEAAIGAGCRMSTGFGGATLYALRETGALPEKFSQAALIVDWLAAQWTGAELLTDRSNAASLGLFDLRRDDWSDPLLAAAGLPREALPRVVDSGSVIGRMTSEASAATGLPAGLPVCCAIGDNQAAIVGSVPGGEEVVQVNIGTGGQLARIVAEFHTVPGMEMRYLPMGRYMLVGAGLAGGDAFAWVKRTATAWLRGFGLSLSDDQIYTQLESLMLAAPADAAGLQCQPYFRGTRQQPQARGEFRGVTNENFTPANVGRSVVNGIAAGMRRFYELAGEGGAWGASRIIATGNAVRRNPLLTQAISNAIGLPIDVPAHREEAAFGAALLAGSQTGLWADLDQAGRCIRHERLTTPAGL